MIYIWFLHDPLNLQNGIYACSSNIMDEADILSTISIVSHHRSTDCVTEFGYDRGELDHKFTTCPRTSIAIWGFFLKIFILF